MKTPVPFPFLPVQFLAAMSWVCLAAITLGAAPRLPDIAYRLHLLDPGANETAAIADLNRDGKPDIISGERWYEAPTWQPHPLREINSTRNYIDNFSDLPVDVDGDGNVDIVQVSYFAHNMVWLKNPGPGNYDRPWAVTEIDATSLSEFAFLVDLNNDGKALEILPQFGAKVPAVWFELQQGKWVKHVVSTRSYGHGIGAGDVNGDGRNDIITPEGWLEAPADVHADTLWVFHPTDWNLHPIAPSAPASSAAPPPSGKIQFGFMHVIDLNGDGRNDILTTSAHAYGLCWFEQLADGTWKQHVIDNSWSQAHASLLVDINGDGRLDFVTGKRYMAHNGADVGEREPIGLYWYDYHRDETGALEWTRHLIDYGGRMGGGMQICVQDLDGDGDLDVVTGGKAGLTLAENLTVSSVRKK